MPKQQAKGIYHAYLLGIEKCSFNTIYCAELHYNYTQQEIVNKRSLNQQPLRRNWMNLDELETLQIQEKVERLLERVSKHYSYEKPLKLMDIIEGEYSHFPDHHYHVIIDVMKEDNSTV